MTQLPLHVRQHLYALLYDQMKICGCGLPGRSFDLVHGLLATAKERRDTRAVLADDGARHIVLSVLDNVDLIEHGSIIDAPWLTRKGQWYLRAFEQATWEDIEDDAVVGLPHDGQPCTEACLKPFWVS